MILRWLRDDQDYPKDSTLSTQEREERARFLEIIQTESVWTADLVLLIDQLFKQWSDKNQSFEDEEQRPQHGYLFCSKTLAVDVGFRDFSYYQAAFLQDQVRVTEKFQELGRLGSNTLRLDHLPLNAVINVVANRNCVAIVLMDNSTLFRTSSSHDNNLSRLGGVFAALGLQSPQKETFAGHYVVLCGISTNPDDVQMAQSVDRETYINGGCKDSKDKDSKDDSYCLVLLDPAPGYTPKVVFVTPQRFERGWRAKGTDDDIIFVAKHS
jgi:hypothetical protein